MSPTLRTDDTQAAQLLDWSLGLSLDQLLAPEDIQQTQSALVALGWQIQQIGTSSAGKPIHALHRPGIGKKVLAYGYPHPDEPSGAGTLFALARALQGDDLPQLLDQAQWWIVLCADPDQAAENQAWIRSPGLQNYLEHHWRPIYQHLEVDYQFPIDHPPFWQPKHQSLRGISPPLPESLALAGLIEKIQPDLLGLMHANHVSGVYSFVSHRPHPSLIQAWDKGTLKIGLAPHLGERPDPGKRWKTKRPDLLKERRLADRLHKAQQRFGDLSGRRLVGCVSVAQFLESHNPQAVVLTPEVGLWQPPGIGDLRISPQQRQVQLECRLTDKGYKQFWYGKLKMPDGSLQPVCYHILPIEEPQRRSRRTVTLTTGMAGVEAVEYRRWFLQRADQIYRQSHLPYETVRLFERSQISVPGKRVNDQSMLIFRTKSTYQQPASIAQAADLKYRWGMQTALWLGHGLQLYLEQGDHKSARAQAKLLGQAQKALLGGLPAMTTPTQQAQSQAHRLLSTLAALG